MKDKSKKSTYSTTFGVDPKNPRIMWSLPLTFMLASILIPRLLVAQKKRSTSKIVEWEKKKRAKRTKNVLQCPMC